MSEYIIVSSRTKSGRANTELENEVNNKLKNGFKLVGGPCLDINGYLIQAMAR
tara:strand:+ start:18 stop:176 length:159 start_codon:yes stop_codon:yes gene_type:complete